jgi:uncharacterized repeat protein (TIGR03803 family)
VQGSDGSFYGTTSHGGTYTNGTVFKISTNGTLTTLHSFGSVLDTNGFPIDGVFPSAALVQGSDGYFYGTTSYGGTNGGWGTVYKISTDGALTSLYSFGSVQDANGLPLDGANPYAGLVQGSDGYFYGTTCGAGSFPYTYMGSWGTVFKISTDGVLTALHSFAGGNDGGWPMAGLVQGSDGYFYGTTCGGNGHSKDPEPGPGTVFKISTNGTLTTLHSFGSVPGTNSFPIDGANPHGLVRGSDGNFYGTTCCGTYGNGTISRLTIVPQPQLTLIPSGPYVILTWPTNFTGFTLQSTTNLSSPVWTTNCSPPVVIGGQNVVINPITGTQKFCRLSQ